MPLRLFLLVSRGTLPLPAGSQRKICNSAPVGDAAHLGVGAEVTDQLDTIETATHGLHLLLSRISGTACRTRPGYGPAKSFDKPKIRSGTRISAWADQGAQDQAVFGWVAVVAGTHSHRPKALGAVQLDGGPIRLAHLEVQLPHPVVS